MKTLKEKQKTSVANILKVHSLHPEVMKAHLDLYREVMFGPSGLTRTQREMIAVVVSKPTPVITDRAITERRFVWSVKIHNFFKQY